MAGSDAEHRDMPIPIIERRRIEAGFAKVVFDTLTARFGAAEATAILTDVIRASAMQQAGDFAKAEPGGTTFASFIDLYDLWLMNDALEIEVLRRDDLHFDFDVKRCRYAEMYREMGLGHIGHILSCGRDGTFCRGYDPNIRLERTHTLMGGASHCDFRYTYEGRADPVSDASGGSPPKGQGEP